jgi:hypothetical protein
VSDEFVARVAALRLGLRHVPAVADHEHPEGRMEIMVPGSTASTHRWSAALPWTAVVR